MTKTELKEPTKFWLETLLKDEQPKREYLTLADAVAQLNCTLDDLLDEGIEKRLDLYAPVLREGPYVWPVTDRGIPHASLVGSIAGVESVFRAALQYGQYAILLPADIKKLKVEQSVKPSGYICPELVLRHVAEWQQERQQGEQTAIPVERMKGRAKSVAWMLAHPSAINASPVRLDMLRVDSSDLPRLKEALAKPTAAEVSSDAGHSDPGQPSQKDEEHASPSEDDSGQFVMTQQIRAIEAGADAKGFNRKAIPRGGKKALFAWCLENYPKLFKSNGKGDSKFADAWKEANRQQRIIHMHRGIHAQRK